MAYHEPVKCKSCGKEIEFGVNLRNQRRTPIRPSRFDVSKDPRATHAGVEHPVTGRLMIRYVAPGDHVAPDERLVLLHRFECPKSPTYIPESAPLTQAA